MRFWLPLLILIANPSVAKPKEPPILYSELVHQGSVYTVPYRNEFDLPSSGGLWVEKNAVYLTRLSNYFVMFESSEDIQSVSMIVPNGRFGTVDDRSIFPTPTTVEFILVINNRHLRAYLTDGTWVRGSITEDRIRFFIMDCLWQLTGGRGFTVHSNTSRSIFAKR